MHLRYGVVAAVLVAAGGLGIHPATAQTAAPGAALANIGHIVVIFEENRSFDNMFGMFPGANGLDAARDTAPQVDRDGKPYEYLPPIMNSNLNPPAVDTRFPAQLPNAPFQIDRYVPRNVATGDLVHRFYQEQAQIDGGKMDKFAAVSDAGGLVMGYYDFSDTAHWRLAKEYTLADNTFHSAFGGSMLNHSFFVCLCAFRWPDAPPKIVASIDGNGVMLKDGQVSPDGYVINTSRSVFLHGPSDTDPNLLVPAQTMPHIGDRLDAKGLTWKWYSGGYAAAAAGRLPQRFEFHHQPMAYFADLAPGTPGQAAHLKDLADLEADIANDTLPQIVFYKPIAKVNLHPGYTDIASGDEHLSELVAKLQKTSAYKDMLIIVTYDENGGFWDHVAPPKRDRWGPGTRVPLIAIGPMVKRGHVDHTQYEFGSILKTIEDRFGLAPLNDIDAKVNNLAALLQ
jgi:phospholipase C